MMDAGFADSEDLVYVEDPYLLFATSIHFAMNYRLSSVIPFVILMPGCLFAEESEVDITIAMDSRYISEGRNNLDSGGILSADISWSKPMTEGSLNLSAWYAEAWDAEYAELDLSVGYTVEFGASEFGVAYTWLEFPEDNEDDHEVELSLAYNVQNILDLSFSGVYSDEAGGVFFETGLSKEIELKEGLTLVPFVVVGINEGYVTDEHDGLNHLIIGVETSWEITDSISLGAYLACTMGLDEEPVESLEDLVYSGLSLTISR